MYITAEMTSEDILTTNLSILQDTLTPLIYRKSLLALTTNPSTSPSPSPSTSSPPPPPLSVSELTEFIEYLSSELFPTLPSTLQTLTYPAPSTLPPADELAETYPTNTIPPTFTESLLSYGLAADDDDVERLVRLAVETYVAETTRPPPVWSATRKDGCEICEREGGNLTYHHLIPRSTHAKVLKRNWHPEHMLNSVAWLCRPCHSTVHRVADNETLAREYYTVERLLEREDIRRWAMYISKRRWHGPKLG